MEMAGAKIKPSSKRFEGETLEGWMRYWVDNWLYGEYERGQRFNKNQKISVEINEAENAFFEAEYDVFPYIEESGQSGIEIDVTELKIFDQKADINRLNRDNYDYIEELASNQEYEG